MPLLNEDDNLMRDVASGNMEAFKSLVRRYQEQTIRFCYGQLNDYQLAEDVSQEGFFRLYKSAKNYSPNGNFKAFLYTIMINLCRNTYNKRTNNPSRVEVLSYIPDNNSSPLQPLEAEESRLKIRLAIDKLPPKYREVITLRELEDLKYTEIARLLKISLNEVKIRLYRGRTQLAELLKNLRTEELND